MVGSGRPGPVIIPSVIWWLTSTSFGMAVFLASKVWTTTLEHIAVDTPRCTQCISRSGRHPDEPTSVTWSTSSTDKVDDHRPRTPCAHPTGASNQQEGPPPPCHCTDRPRSSSHPPPVSCGPYASKVHTMSRRKDL